MSLRTYDEVRPWARAIKQRTGIGPRAGVMPPWYVEKNIGIQKFKNDPSLSADEIAMIAKWADSGAPRGNPDDMPPLRTWTDSTKWSIGEPDLVVRTTDIVVKGTQPDWWGEIPRVPTGLTEDRYVSALEIREVNDVGSAGTGRATVGGRYVFHHMIWSTRVLGEDAGDPLVPDDSTSWPVHEVGREADFFDAQVGASAEGRIEHRVRLGAPPLERARYDRASRDRLQVHAEGLQAGIPPRHLRAR